MVFLSPSGQMGGAERSLFDILASLRATVPDWSLHLIVAADGPLAARATEIGVPTTILPFPRVLARLGDSGTDGAFETRIGRLALMRRVLSASVAVVAYASRLSRTLRALAPDVVHTNGFKMHILGLWARPGKTPLVWHVHDYVSTRPVMARLLRRHASRCAAVVANSRSVATDVRAVCGDGLKVYPIHNAVDLVCFSPAGPKVDLDALAGLSSAEPGTVRVGLVATMGRWKGHETFLKALSLLPRSLAIRGYIVGGAVYQTDGSQYAQEELYRLAIGLGLSDSVGFTGLIADPAAAMRALDVVVHASTQPEPFGLVILEAMACGRAVIASEAGGAAEIITPGADALGHPPGDAAVLAERIAQLVTNIALRTKLGVAARATAECRFDRMRLASEFALVYGEVRSAAGHR